MELSENYVDCSGDITTCNLSKFEALRALELKGYNLAKIRHCIAKLKHLAYLGITSSRLRMLPLSVGLLYNLHTLILNCDFLEYLPGSIGDLSNLQFLYIQCRSVKKLPKSLGSLSNLLSLVIKSDDLEEIHSDLKKLCNLQELTIGSTRIQALPNTIGSLSCLEELNLSLAGSVRAMPGKNGNFLTLKALKIENLKLDYIPHELVNFPTVKTMTAWLRVRTLAWLKDMKDLKGNSPSKDWRTAAI